MAASHVAPTVAARTWDMRSIQPMAMLDVRERWEYADGHLPAACPMPRGSLELRAPLALPDPTATVFVYSNGDERAELAAGTLESLGFPRVAVVRGGICAWRAAGLPVVTGWGTPGKRVGEDIAHAFPQLHCDSEAVADGLALGDTLVIDVRPRWEHEQGHVPGAVHVPSGDLPHWVPALQSAIKTGQVRAIVTHCAGRTRGIAAAHLLRQLGVTEARALRNGCMGWLLSGRTLEFGPTVLAERAPWLARCAQGCAPGLDDALSPTADELSAAGPARYLLDVREPDAFHAGHIPGALNLPAGQILIESDTWLPTAALPIVLIGDGDEQTRWAALHLRALGYRKVTQLQGGQPAWVKQGGPLEHGAATAGLHAGAGAQLAFVAATHFLADRSAWDVVDVRSAGEFGIAHVDGSRCIPRGTLEQRRLELAAGDRGVLLVSARGIRAQLAAPAVQALVERRLVAVLAGGLAELRAQGLALREDAPDSGIASRDTPGRVSAAVWRQPLARTRPLMERYLAWEEALVRSGQDV